MASFSSRHFPHALVLVILCLLSLGTSDFASDRAECADQLIGLATCLPYIGGDGKAPTPDCCTGFKQVIAKSTKCLCVLIKDRNEPELGLKINVTLALTLPSKCDAPTNVSVCPKLLNLPPQSKEAKEFVQFESALEGKATDSSVKGNSSATGGIGIGTHASGGRKERCLTVDMGARRWIWSLLIVPLLVLGS